VFNLAHNHHPPPPHPCPIDPACPQSLLSKPVYGFIASIALSAIAIRRHGDKSSLADANLRKLFVASTTAAKSKERVTMDADFVWNVWKLLKIMCPGVWSE
jgi:hypothetical protein